MDDKTRAAQGAVPDREAAEAEQTTIEQMHYSGGNALLDAQIQASERINNDPFV
jgi:hypothetical protein